MPKLTWGLTIEMQGVQARRLGARRQLSFDSLEEVTLKIPGERVTGAGKKSKKTPGKAKYKLAGRKGVRLLAIYTDASGWGRIALGIGSAKKQPLEGPLAYQGDQAQEMATALGKGINLENSGPSAREVTLVLGADLKGVSPTRKTKKKSTRKAGKP